jgi:hypothetical protein
MTEALNYATLIRVQEEDEDVDEDDEGWADSSPRT